MGFDAWACMEFAAWALLEGPAGALCCRSSLLEGLAGTLLQEPACNFSD